jgi:hypothetical protein
LLPSLKRTENGGKYSRREEIFLEAGERIWAGDVVAGPIWVCAMRRGMLDGLEKRI